MIGRSEQHSPDAAFFIASLGMGGAEKSALGVTAGLAARGLAVDLVVARADGPLVGHVAPAVRLVDLGAPRMAAAGPRLAWYLRRHRPDVLLASVTHACLTALVAARLGRKQTPVVVIEQSTLRRMTAQSPLRRDRLLPGLARRFYPMAAAVVCVSHGVAADLEEVSPAIRDRITVVPNPVVSPALLEAANEPLSHQWFAPGQPPVVLGVGRLAPEKDFGTLLEAFAIVRHGRAARLVLVGDGPERPALVARASDLGVTTDVSIVGLDLNPYRYMARAGVVVLSSRVEGTPTVLVEALTVGAPVVATDCESGPREILDSGQLGRLVPVGEATTMAAAIANALDDGRDDRGTPPAEMADRYGVERVVSRYHELVSDVAAQALRHRRS